jgi:hypothetical protein
MSYLDFFYPDHPDWSDAGTAVPNAIREEMPQLSWTNVTVRQRTLPFYPDLKLLVMRGEDWAPPGLFIYALQKDDEVRVLSGKSPPIHAFNAEGHLTLTADNVISYLQFFCFFVHGEEGPFYLVSDRSSDYLPAGLRQGTRTEALASAQDDFAARYQSARFFGQSPDAKWRCSGTILYANAIFIADFLVQKGGMIEMVSDTPVLADLPVKIWAPIAPPSETNATLH